MVIEPAAAKIRYLRKEAHESAAPICAQRRRHVAAMTRRLNVTEPAGNDSAAATVDDIAEAPPDFRRVSLVRDISTLPGHAATELTMAKPR